jgi:hypothetical protein
MKWTAHLQSWHSGKADPAARGSKGGPRGQTEDGQGGCEALAAALLLQAYLSPSRQQLTQLSHVDGYPSASSKVSTFPMAALSLRG